MQVVANGNGGIVKTFDGRGDTLLLLKETILGRRNLGTTTTTR